MRVVIYTLSDSMKHLTIVQFVFARYVLGSVEGSDRGIAALRQTQLDHQSHEEEDALAAVEPRRSDEIAGSATPTYQSIVVEFLSSTDVAKALFVNTLVTLSPEERDQQLTNLFTNAVPFPRDPERDKEIKEEPFEDLVAEVKLAAARTADTSDVREVTARIIARVLAPRSLEALKLVAGFEKERIELLEAKMHKLQQERDALEEAIRVDRARQVAEAKAQEDAEAQQKRITEINAGISDEGRKLINLLDKDFTIREAAVNMLDYQCLLALVDYKIAKEDIKVVHAWESNKSAFHRPFLRLVMHKFFYTPFDDCFLSTDCAIIKQVIRGSPLALALFVEHLLGTRTLQETQRVLDNLTPGATKEIKPGRIRRVLTFGLAKSKTSHAVPITREQMDALTHIFTSDIIERIASAFPDWTGGLDGPSTGQLINAALGRALTSP